MSARGVVPAYWAAMAGLCARRGRAARRPVRCSGRWPGCSAPGPSRWACMRHRPRTCGRGACSRPACSSPRPATAPCSWSRRAHQAWLRLLADALYFAMFASTATALWRLSRSASPMVEPGRAHRRRDAWRPRSSLLTWVGVLGPRIGSVPFAEAAPLVAYLIGRRAAARHGRAAGDRCAGRPGPCACWRWAPSRCSCADVLSTLQHTAGWRTAGLADLWPRPAVRASGGPPACTASMARLTEPEMLPAGTSPNRRLYVLALTSLIGPAVLIGQFALGGPVDAVLIGLATAADLHAQPGPGLRRGHGQPPLAGLPRAPRHADRSGQPVAVRRTPHRDHGDAGRVAAQRRRAAHRPGRVQAGQRHHGTCRRRRGAGRRRPPPCPQPRPPRPGGPLRR